MDDADEEFCGRSKMPSRGPQGPARPTPVLDIEHACRNSLEGWLLFAVAFPVCDSSARAPRILYLVPLASALHVPTTVASEARRDTKVAARDFRMLDGAREFEIPLADTSREAWPLPERPVQDGQHHWRVGLLPGPHTSGEGASYMAPVKPTPPALRKVGIREIPGGTFHPRAGGLFPVHKHWRLLGLLLHGVPELRGGLSRSVLATSVGASARALWRLSRPQSERSGPPCGPNVKGGVQATRKTWLRKPKWRIPNAAPP